MAQVSATQLLFPQPSSAAMPKSSRQNSDRCTDISSRQLRDICRPLVCSWLPHEGLARKHLLLLWLDFGNFYVFAPLLRLFGNHLVYEFGRAE